MIIIMTVWCTLDRGIPFVACWSVCAIDPRVTTQPPPTLIQVSVTFICLDVG